MFYIIHRYGSSPSSFVIFSFYFFNPSKTRKEEEEEDPKRNGRPISSSPRFLFSFWYLLFSYFIKSPRARYTAAAASCVMDDGVDGKWKRDGPQALWLMGFSSACCFCFFSPARIERSPPFDLIDATCQLTEGSAGFPRLARSSTQKERNVLFQIIAPTARAWSSSIPVRHICPFRLSLTLPWENITWLGSRTTSYRRIASKLAAPRPNIWSDWKSQMCRNSSIANRWR